MTIGSADRKLTVTTTPPDATIVNQVWESEDEIVAKVIINDDGVPYLRAISSGGVIISLTTQGENGPITDSIGVNVTP